jgi:hypothetical protein
MKKNINAEKSMRIFALTLAVLVSLSAFASALGVSLGPSRERPLLLGPGESESVHVNLQNALGDEDLTVTLSVSQGSEVARTSDESYLLKAGSTNTYATVEISVPRGAELGTEYLVTLSLRTVDKGDAGQMVGLGSAIDVTFPVRVVESQSEEAAQPAPALNSQNVWMLVAIVALALLAWIIWKLSKRK